MASTQTPQYKRFLQRLRAARRAADLSQAEVGRRLRRPQSFVAKCEAGERRLDVIELAEFAAIYERPVAFFVERGRRRQ